MKNILLFPIALFILAGCTDMEEEISWETKNIPAKAVVDGGITSDSCFQLITLSQAGDYFINEETKRISNADITVTDGLHTYTFHESDTVPGNYYSTEKFAGVPGTTLSLSVNLAEPIDGTSMLYASDQMIKGFSIDSMEAIIYENPFPGEDEDTDTTMAIFFINGKKPSKDVNYYMIRIFRNGISLNNNVKEILLYNDEYSEDTEETELVIYTVEDIIPNDTVSIELTTISKVFYKYLETIEQVATPPDPMGFSGSPADAIGNINNGSELGFFFAGSKSRYTTIAKMDENSKISGLQ